MSLADIERLSLGRIKELMMDVVGFIITNVRERPGLYLTKKTLHSKLPGVEPKDALVIDEMAEQLFRSSIEEEFPFVEVFGEEDPQPKDHSLEANDNVCALVDMVDGTDLVERGLYNWCSSAVFFHPRSDPGNRIIASFIGIPGRGIYYATRDQDYPTLATFDDDKVEIIEDINGCSDIDKLSEASICFYGQKRKNLFRTATMDLFEGFPKEEKENLRVYNLAGMPMITKLIDKRVPNASNIDAVFDINGQKPHDVVPGAYLAMKADCVVRKLTAVTDIKGKTTGFTSAKMTNADLENSLLMPFSPNSSLKYLIASTKPLADEIESLLRWRSNESQ